MQLTGVDGNALTSAGLVQDPAEKLRRRARLADATIEETVVGYLLWEPSGQVPAIAKPLRKRGWGLKSPVPVERRLGIKLIRTASVGSWGPGWSLCRVASSAVPIPQRPKLSSCSRPPHHVAPRTSSPSMPLR